MRERMRIDLGGFTYGAIFLSASLNFKKIIPKAHTLTGRKMYLSEKGAHVNNIR